MEEERTYMAIDLKSFYASAECVDMGLDPLTTNLVVADLSRTEKTICLAVSPSLKACGISGRARLFEVVQRVKEVNAERRRTIGGRAFSGESADARELTAHPELKLTYHVARPRMKYYVSCSTKIYKIYLRWIAPEDIHVYSIDEVMMDVTDYLRIYGCSARELAAQMMGEVLKETGITATAGIGTNLYLCKIAMDIMAKHVRPDKDGMRIAELDEEAYRRRLWKHRPLTDFWRVGRGYAEKLEQHGLYTMGDIARCSIGKSDAYYNEDLLYKLFGVNAELLIDHAWGWEPCRIADVKAYRPENSSICSGQVLQTPYPSDKARLIVQEMADLLALELVEKRLVSDQLVLTIGYDTANLTDPEIGKKYHGQVTIDRYGRRVPRHAHGTQNLHRWTSSSKEIMEGVLALFDRINDPLLLVRRVTIDANHLRPEEMPGGETDAAPDYRQLDMFTDYRQMEEERQSRERERQKERRMQEAVLALKHRFGKNAVVRGMNLQEGATTISRNRQIGGHRE